MAGCSPGVGGVPLSCQRQDEDQNEAVCHGAVADHHREEGVTGSASEGSHTTTTAPSSPPECSVHRYLYTQVGSFQVFVKGYKDAEVQLELFKSDVLPPHLERALQLEFERLVVLDYIIRNTDRGNDNWLLRYEEPTIHGELNDVDVSLDISRSVCQLPLFCGTRELGPTTHSWDISY